MRRWIVNVFWREAGHPGLPMTETHCCLVATEHSRRSVASMLVSQVREAVAGVYGIRVLFTPHPQPSSASDRVTHHATPQREAAPLGASVDTAALQVLLKAYLQELVPSATEPSAMSAHRLAESGIRGGSERSPRTIHRRLRAEIRALVRRFRGGSYSGASGSATVVRTTSQRPARTEAIGSSAQANSGREAREPETEVGA